MFSENIKRLVDEEPIILITCEHDTLNSRVQLTKVSYKNFILQFLGK